MTAKTYHVCRDEHRVNLPSASYTANALSQYSSRSNPARVDIIGLAGLGSSVTVNGSGSAYRDGQYFQKNLSVTNNTYPAITVSAGTNSASGSLYVPPSTESYTYDDDGNLLSDGRWSYLWDAENRLIEMRWQTNAPSAAKLWLKFEYDYLGRRIQKTAAQWTNSAWSLVVSNRFLFDGWNAIAELNATNNTLIRGYLWGVDLSGSLQGAGGVGGLIAVKERTGDAHFAAYDGNGNVIALVNATTGTYSAQYEYDPFGQTIRSTGAMARGNPFRFSTKYQDEESGFSDYGYRYCNPRTGRWLTLDPLEERGGYKLYAFFSNDSPTSIDYTGLTEISVSAGLGLGLRVSGSVTIESSQENGMRVITLTGEGSAGVGVALKRDGKAFGQTFGVGFDFEGPSIKEKRIIKVTISCDGYVNFHSSINLVRLSAAQTFRGGVGLRFVAIHEEVNLHYGGLASDINAVPHVLSTWLEWNGEKSASYKITGGFGENTDVVLVQGKSSDSHTFHKLIARPLIFKF